MGRPFPKCMGLCRMFWQIGLTTLLPVELRPPLWRRIALVLTALFYGAISFAMFHQIFSR